MHISEDNVYRSLDSIIARKDEIEIDLFNTLKPDTSTVHYDLTSSYFEGRENNDLVLFGYSWDKKRGKEQIVIGLVIADGIPIHNEVWPGNTVDPKTLESTISVLKERFLIKNVTFVGDGAFGRSKSLNLLDQNRYITAAYRLDQPYRNILMETDLTYFQTMNDLIIKKVTINVNDVMKEEKTGITEAENGFDFLGFHFVRHFSSRRNKRVTRWLPSKMSMKAIRQKIREKTGNKALSAMTPWNALKGWRPPSKDGSTTSGAASVGNHLPAHGNKLTNASD